MKKILLLSLENRCRLVCYTLFYFQTQKNKWLFVVWKNDFYLCPTYRTSQACFLVFSYQFSEPSWIFWVWFFSLQLFYHCHLYILDLIGALFKFTFQSVLLMGRFLKNYFFCGEITASSTLSTRSFMQVNSYHQFSTYAKFSKN